MARKYENRKLKPSVIRGCTIGAVFVVVAIGLAFHTGTGTLSSMGIGIVASICPLGALESFFGTWAFVPRAVIVLVVVIVAVFLVGESFCSWICPVPPLRQFLKTRKVKDADQADREEAAHVALENYQTGSSVERPKIIVDSRHWVLLGALASTAIFGFPVFCLICPIGLTFATFIALWQLFQLSEATWSLLVFPAILAVELVVMRKWCHKICPLGALFSLISTRNKTFRPQVDETKCLRHVEDAPCDQCERACPEFIDPNSDLGIRPIAECTRCNRCAETCPAGAISFPFLAKSGNSTKATSLAEVKGSVRAAAPMEAKAGNGGSE